MKIGDFIRVKTNHENFARQGKDGMVVELWKNVCALVFYNDRHNHSQHCICVGPEIWKFDELDLNTIF